MSASNEAGSWVDRWWQVLVILFGVIFVTILDTFAPTI